MTDASDLWRAIDEAKAMAAAAATGISAHEELCGERYKGINEKLGWIIGGIGMLFLGLVGWMAVQLYTLEPLKGAGSGASAYGGAGHHHDALGLLREGEAPTPRRTDPPKA